MGGFFVGNSSEYNIHSEYEIAEILSHYDSDFIQNIMDENLSKRYDISASVIPVNIVNSLEQNFKQIINYYTEQQGEIYQRRTDTYNTIIEKICQAYGIGIRSTYDPANIFPLAFWMYDFFVCNYVRYAIYFIASVIERDLDALYASLNLDDMKREAILADKKMYSERPKLGVVMNNLITVIDNICVYDFSIQDIIMTCINNKEAAECMISAIEDHTGFFKVHYGTLFKSEIRGILITEIRMLLHNNYCSRYNIQQIPVV